MDFTFSDIMIHVNDMAKATDFWVSVMGLEVVQSESDWVMLQNTENGQRFVFTQSEFGMPWALSVSTTNIQSTIEALVKGGCEILQNVETPNSPFQYALCKDNSGIPILIFST